MWEDNLKRKKSYTGKVQDLVNEVCTGKIVGADFKKVKQLLADEDLDIRFHVELQVERGEFVHFFTFAAKTFMEFLKELATTIVGMKIPSLGREFNKNRDTIRIYSDDV